MRRFTIRLGGFFALQLAIAMVCSLANVHFPFETAVFGEGAKPQRPGTILNAQIAVPALDPRCKPASLCTVV